MLKYVFKNGNLSNDSGFSKRDVKSFSSYTYLIVAFNVASLFEETPNRSNSDI